MAARRNIVPTAEISIAATVVDPSLLLFASFFFSVFFLLRRNAPDEKRRLFAQSESANWARLISQAMDFQRERRRVLTFAALLNFGREREKSFCIYVF